MPALQMEGQAAQQMKAAGYFLRFSDFWNKIFVSLARGPLHCQVVSPASPHGQPPAAGSATNECLPNEAPAGAGAGGARCRYGFWVGSTGTALKPASQATAAEPVADGGGAGGARNGLKLGCLGCQDARRPVPTAGACPGAGC